MTNATSAVAAAALSALHSDVGYSTEAPPRELSLALTVNDPETVYELWRRTAGEPRDTFALAALRLGVLAMRQASGAVDGATVRQEGERLVSSVRELLNERSGQLMSSLSDCLRRYFDPTDGDLPQRLDRLLKRDGELESLMARQIGDDDSTLARTLAQHVGETSPLIKLLSPDQADGVVGALAETIRTALDDQRKHVLQQFSLDHENSALSRLLKQIVDANGNFRKDLAVDLEKLCSEFSLDNEEGALTHLVRQVDRAQKSILEEFSNDNEHSALRRMTKLLESTSSAIRTSLTLDDEKSPLARLRRELMTVLEEQNKANQSFQTEVRTVLEAAKVRREEAARSTVHGGEFQDEVGAILQAEAQRLGDLFADVGDTAGAIPPRCKVGDHLITLGTESAAPGAKIVSESKADRTYDLRKAKAEIEQARQNRGAQVGIFVFSAATAPAGLESLCRYGDDIMVVWDRDNPATDLLLKCALSVARALVIRQGRASAAAEANFDELDAAILKIGKDAAGLVEVCTWANTVQSSGKKIAERVEKVRESLEKQLELLQEHVGRLKDTLQETASG